MFDSQLDALDESTMAKLWNQFWDLLSTVLRYHSVELLWTLMGTSAAVVCVLLLMNRVPLQYTLRNLTVRWITTTLTVLAFILVVGLMVVMSAFTTGMKRMTEGTGEPANVLVLSEGADDEVFSTIDGDVAAKMEVLKEVLRDGDKTVTSRETYLIVNQPVAHPREDRPHGRFLQIRGVVDTTMAARA